LAVISTPVLSWWLRNDEAAVWLHVMMAFAIACAFFTWPRPIHLDSEGVWQRSLFGRVRRIAWREIDSAGIIPSESKAIVGGGEKEIIHGMLHQNRDQFCELIEQRTGKQFFVGAL
jgi:hypothetical protein